jgi:protoporphyrinogen oxidase
MKRTRYLILGAGPTGLGAARRLHELGQSDWLMLEAGNEAGGLASSFQDDRGFNREEITAFDANHANAKKHPWPYERWQQSKSK